VGEAIFRWAAVCQEDFGSARTVGEAWKANPRAVLWHLGVNLRTLPTALKDMIEPELGLPPFWRKALYGALIGLLTLGAIGCVRRLLPRAEPEQAAQAAQAAEPVPGDRGLMLGLIVLGCLSVPTLASCLGVFPQRDYLVPGVVLSLSLLPAGVAGMAGVAPSVRGSRVWARLDSLPGLLLLGGLLAAMTPNLAHGWSLQGLGRRRPAQPSLIFQKRVPALRALNLQGSAVALDCAALCTVFYAGLPVQFVPVDSKDVPFREFMRRGNISIVFLDPELIDDVAYRDDPEFKEFAAGGEEGFAYIRVPEARLRIAVRKDLLPRHEKTPPPSPLSASGRGSQN